MSIAPGRTAVKDFKVEMYQQSLEFVESFKYLGQMIDNKLTGADHLAKVIEKVDHVISRIQSIKSQLSLEKIL